MSRSILKLQIENCRKKIRELEEEVKRLRGQLAAIRDWLEEVEQEHVILSLRVYDLKLEVEKE